MRSASSRSRFTLDRFQVVLIALGVFFFLIFAKLFWLQIVQSDAFERLATEQNTRGVVLPAKRGTIFVQDYRTGELHPIAQNTTTYTIFADPMLVANEPAIADALAPLLYVPTPQKPDAAAPVAEPKPSDAAAPVAVTPAAPAAAATPAPIPIDPRVTFHDQLLQQLTTKDVTHRIISAVTPEEGQLIAQLQLPGITVEAGQIGINPNLIGNPDTTAAQLAAVLGKSYTDIVPLLHPQRLRYVKLAGRVDSLHKDQILAPAFKGIGALPEYRRVYPENELAAQVVGFLDQDGKGSYGIESEYQKDLAGVDGLRRTQVDPMNRQITAGDITIDDAKDGTNIVLTLDRTMQAITEKELAAVVTEQRADSGQAIIMDPHTGAILTLAHYPFFDPNHFGDTYAKVPVTNPADITTEFERKYVIKDGWRYPLFFDGNQPVIYKNRVGPAAFSLKAVNEPFEPGSIFKSVVMASALDAHIVTPQTRSPYDGPVTLDETINGKPIVIRNANSAYYGHETMTEVIGHSSNIGMTFVVQKMGKAMFYDYLTKFGFGQRTDVDLEGESPGKLANYTQWTKSEQVTKSFGQGITVNLIQMAVAYSALANGGLLMHPYMVADKIDPLTNKHIPTEPQTVRRVISPDTSAVITGMLISSVEHFYAKVVRLPGYYISGKTGTSQTYSKSGRAFTDTGTTIATFAGYAPATDPKFVMVVKVDRPRTSQWGEGTAGKVFHEVAKKLLENYYAVAPTK